MVFPAFKTTPLVCFGTKVLGGARAFLVSSLRVVVVQFFPFLVCLTVWEFAMEMWHRACPLCFSGIQDQTTMATDCIGSGTLTSRQTMSSDKSARARSGSWASQVARNSSSSRIFSSLSHALRLRQLSQSAECVVRELRPSTRRQVRFNERPNNAGDAHAAYARPAWMEQRNRFIAALMQPGQCQHQAEQASPSRVYLLPVCAFGREMARG
jgi:hypothetical protein